MARISRARVRGGAALRPTRSSRLLAAVADSFLAEFFLAIAVRGARWSSGDRGER